jgi:hypothetical protein
MAIHEVEYLWEHWKFNADQRIKAFNFFVVFSVFANGGVFAAIEKCAHPAILILIGGFIIALSGAFWIIDIRTQILLRLSIPGLKDYEKTLTPNARLFHLDLPNRRGFVRFTFAFRVLFALQLLFGAVMLAYGVVSLSPQTFGVKQMPVLSKCK